MNVVAPPAPHAGSSTGSADDGERIPGVTLEESVMVTFDSPVYRCEGCGEFVLMDQTVRECSEEHHCDAADCPVLKLFEGQDSRRETLKGKTPGAVSCS